MRLAWQIVIAYAAVAGLAFVVSYWWLAPWWRSEVGRNLMSMALALTAIFGLLALRQLVGPLGLLVWFVSVLVIAVTLTHQTYLLIREHRRARPVKELTDMSDTVPAVPPRVRTVAYFALLTASALVLLATGLAPIWLGVDIATKVVASGGVATSVLGLIAGGLGVAYRPTRTE